MAGYWLKLYTEILDDPKYHKLTINGKLGMIELMVVAKRMNQDGEIPSIEEVAFYTRRSVKWWTRVFEELVNIEYLVSNGSKTIVRKFSERQAAVDGAERIKKFRELKHKNEFVKRECNEPVTNRYGDSDSDSDSDSEKSNGTQPTTDVLFVGEFLKVSEIHGLASNDQGYEIIAFRDKYGPEVVLSAALWLKEKGIKKIEKALSSLRTALPTWTMPTKKLSTLAQSLEAIKQFDEEESHAIIQ